MTQAARAAAAASKSASRSSSSSSSSSSSAASSGSEAPEAHPSKRQKRSHADDNAIEQTPPPSPTLDSSDLDTVKAKIDFEAIRDDIVEAVVIQLQSTGNRPHLVKELATVLAQRLTSVQQ
jgi:sRNA-binding protein